MTRQAPPAIYASISSFGHRYPCTTTRRRQPLAADTDSVRRTNGVPRLHPRACIVPPMCCAGILVPRSAPRVLREALLKAGALVLLAAADVHLQVVSDGLDEGGRWSSSLHLARPVRRLH